MIHTLRFQITAALLLLLLVFAASVGFGHHHFERYRTDNAVLNLATQLRITTQRLNAEGMKYLEVAPSDYPGYYRDVKLYYPNLLAQVGVFDQASRAFMAGRFPPKLTGLDETVTPGLDKGTRTAAAELEAFWDGYRQQLMDALGNDIGGPRLESAAQYVVRNHAALEAVTERLLAEFRRLVDHHVAQIARLNQAGLILAVLLALMIVAWFYIKVLRPLHSAVGGFRKVAQGDFGYQVPVAGNNEIGWLSGAFNHLSMRLHAIFRLIERIQHGSDLDETLGFVREEFSRFLPIDWVGALLVCADGTSIELRRAYAGDRLDNHDATHFPLEGTLLADALASGRPLHLTDLATTAQQSEAYRFLRALAGKGMGSAIFLPLSEQSPVPGLLVFASRRADAYTPGHLELLTNIAHLVTYSFGRTLELLERARLAAIGQFASGIVHEIRSPLSTVSLALDYFLRQDLPEATRKRAELAGAETARMTRLLEDILLYAKPLSLKRERLDFAMLLHGFLDTNRSLAERRQQSFGLQVANATLEVIGDRDRLAQVLLNLARNACEAAPDGAEIGWQLDHSPRDGSIRIVVENPGDPIPETALARLWEPFFTTKAGGTGLGLSIVKRIIEAHGGEITIASDETSGTRVTIRLPAADSEKP